MKQQLFAKKPLSVLEMEMTGDNKLKRVLGPVSLTSLGIGAIIGAGIFVLTGSTAALYSGPALVISFVISGLACAFAGLCYAEFAAMIPISGSAYAYAYATLGEFLAWIIGWDLIIEYLFAASTVSVGWSGYAVSLLEGMNIHIPASLTAATGTTLYNIPGQGWKEMTETISAELAKNGTAISSLPHMTALFNLPAIFIVGVLTLVLIRGIKESSTFNNIMVIVKVSVVILFIGIGFMYVDAHNWTPFIPENTGTFGHFGWSGILRGAGVIFFAYIGFDAVSTAAQEAKNPQRDMPIGILGSLTVSTILYILVAIVLTGIVNYKDLNVAAPVALGVDRMGSGMVWLGPIIKIAALAGLTSVILVMLLGQPRIFYSMSKDGLLPPVFSKVHEKYKTPFVSQLLTGAVAMILAGVLPISILGELVSIGTLLAFAIVSMSVLVLRKTHPEIPRPFKTPFMPWVPILGTIVCLAQMLALPFDTWLRLIIWMAIGLAIYFFYGRHRSVVHKLITEQKK